MFFYASKILMFLIQPMVWVFALLIWSLLTKKPKRRRNLILSSVVIFYIFSNSFLVDEIYRVWEEPAIKIDSITEQYDYAIVLGGVAYYDKSYNKLGIVRSFDRVLQALELYKAGKVKKIFLSGGSGSIIDDDFIESHYVREFLVRLGVEAQDIEYEANSRNTRENALSTVEYFSADSLKSLKFILVTSAFHMKRAMGCYEKCGIKVLPFVADRYSGPRKYVPDHLIIPNKDAIGDWTLIIHELIGYMVYYFSGYL
jgi:uncharacterized SAM-binding protein YcdF (DUF218 family)